MPARPRLTPRSNVGAIAPRTVGVKSRTITKKDVRVTKLALTLTSSFRNGQEIIDVEKHKDETNVWMKGVVENYRERFFSYTASPSKTRRWKRVRRSGDEKVNTLPETTPSLSRECSKGETTTPPPPKTTTTTHGLEVRTYVLSLRVKDLKDELRKRNLDTFGVKKILRDRLSRALTTEEGETVRESKVRRSKTTAESRADAKNDDDDERKTSVPSSPFQKILDDDEGRRYCQLQVSTVSKEAESNGGSESKDNVCVRSEFEKDVSLIDVGTSDETEDERTVKDKAVSELNVRTESVTEKKYFSSPPAAPQCSPKRTQDSYGLSASKLPKSKPGITEASATSTTTISSCTSKPSWRELKEKREEYFDKKVSETTIKQDEKRQLRAAQMREKAAAEARKNAVDIEPLKNNAHPKTIRCGTLLQLQMARENAKKHKLQMQQMSRALPQQKTPPYSYEISDKEESDSDDESDGDDESEDESKPKKRFARWTKKDHLIPALDRQFGDWSGRKDPDKIFSTIEMLVNLDAIFANKTSKYRRRNSSGDWLNDRVTPREDLTYRRQMGFS